MILAVLATALPAQDKPAAETTAQTVVKEVSKQTAPLASEVTEMAKTGNEALRFMLDKAKAYTGKTEDAVGWVVDKIQTEAPETIRQFLLWRQWMHGIYYFLPFTLGVIAVAAFFFCLKRSKWGYAGPDNAYAAWATFAGCVAVIWIIITLTSTHELLSLIQIKVAPRIYLIEQLTQLLK